MNLDFRHFACALALTFGYLAAAIAVERSEDSYGDLLLFPYFGAQQLKGSGLMLSLRDQGGSASGHSGAAVRVAFRQPQAADGSRPEPLLVNLVLTPDDSWFVSLSERSFLTWDRSCVQVGRGGTLLATWPDTPRDLEVPNSAGEGWIEVYELGRVTDPDLLGLARSDCQALWSAVRGLDAEDWLTPPKGDLRGVLHFVEHNGPSYSIAPVALRGFRHRSTVAPVVIDHPTLADASPPQARVREADGGWRTATFAQHPAHAVSAVLMDESWEFDYASHGSRTDLVIALPTRAFHGEGESSRPPFAHHPRIAPQGAAEILARAIDSEGEGFSLWAPKHAKCSPPPPPRPYGPRLQGELLVLEFGSGGVVGSAFGHTLRQLVSLDSCGPGGRPIWELQSGGRLSIRFDRAPLLGIGSLKSDEGHLFFGQPAIGAALIRSGFPIVAGTLQPISRRGGHQSNVSHASGLDARDHAPRRAPEAVADQVLR